MIIKTSIKKRGDISMFMSSPIYDKININAYEDRAKVIGKIIDIEETDFTYVLTMEIDARMQFGWTGELGESQISKIAFNTGESRHG